MPTHRAPCRVCGAEMGCCSTGVYGSGRSSPCDSDSNPALFIEFCSKDCFDWLKARMAERELRAEELFPELYGHTMCANCGMEWHRDGVCLYASASRTGGSR